MGYPPPIVRRGEILLTDQLLPGEHVPQAELGLEPAVGLARQPSGDQRLRVDDFPIREPRHRVGVDDLFDVGGGINRREQAGAAQIRGDHLTDAARELAVGRAAAEEVGNGDRHRLDVAFGDLQPEHRAGGPDHAGRGDAGRSSQQPAARQQVRAR